MIKAALKRYAIRVFMTVLVLASVIAIVKTSWMYQVFQDIAAGMCLLGSWLCARALRPRNHDEDVTQPVINHATTAMMSMPTVPLDVVDLPMRAPLMPTPYADVMDAWLRAEQRSEMQQLLGEQQEGEDV